MSKSFRITALRLLSAALNLCASFTVLAAALRYEGASKRAFMVAISFLPFIPLLQLGLGRPIYTFIRFELGGIAGISERHGALLRWFATSQVGAVSLCGAVVYLVARSLYGSSPSEWLSEVAPLILIYAASCGLLLRDLFYAVDAEVAFEISEIGRRSALLGGTLLLAHQSARLAAIFVLAISLVVTASALNWVWRRVEHARRRSAGHSVARTGFKIKNAAPAYFSFQVLDITFYSIPLWYVLWRGAAADLALFNYWTRLFLVCCLLPRMWLDSTLNSRVGIHVAEGLRAAQRALLHAANRCAALAFCASLLAVGAAPFLARTLGAPETIGAAFSVSLVLWAIANSYVHAQGTFLVSIPNGARAAALLSLVQMASGAACFGLAYVTLGQPFGVSMLSSGCGYALVGLLGIIATPVILKFRGSS